MLNSYQQIIEILEEIKELSNKSEKLSDKVQTLLKRQKNIMETNDKNHARLLDYRILFQDYTQWESRKEYFEIINDFLNKKIDGDNFCRQVGTLERRNLDEAKEIEENLRFKTDFHLTSEAINFSNVLGTLDSMIEIFDPTLNDSESSSYGLSENGLKDVVKDIIIPKFSKYYNID